MSEKADKRFMSGEDQLELIQEELEIEINDLLEEFIMKIRSISKDREGYDLRGFALRYLKDSL